MSFLTPILLAGMAAFSIPLVIHLLNRRRFTEMPWAAMHLLEVSTSRSKRRMELLELLLLLTRIAIPVLLALALAGPILKGLRHFTGQKSSSVVLLDESYSMQAVEGGRVVFSRSREETGALLEGLPRGCEAQVVLMGAGAPLLDSPTSVVPKLVERLKGIEAIGGPIDAAGALRMAGAQLGAMGHPAAEVIVMSDFRKGDWGVGGEAGRAEAAEALREEAAGAEITLFAQGGEAENFSVFSVEVSALVLGRGQRFTVRANLRNHGKGSYPSVPVVFEAEGQEVGTSRVALPPGGDAQVLFTHVFDEAGEKQITIRAEGDALEADNAFYLVLPVWEEVPVRIINGHPSAAPLEGETDFLEMALRPFEAAGSGELADLIRPVVTTSDRVPRDLIEETRVVVVANARDLNGMEELREFVREGGGLIFFPGDKVDAKWWEKEAHGGRSMLLPCRIGELAGGRGTAAGMGRIPSQRLTHPALALFNDRANGRFDRVELSLWHRLEVTEEAREDRERNVRVLMRLDNGDPLAVEHSFGKGRVIQFAIPADADWGNLPTQPVYLPMMQRLVTYLATEGTARSNLETGEVLRAVFPGGGEGVEMLVIDPAGEERLVAMREEKDLGIIEFEATAAPGFYRVAPVGDGAGEGRVFAVNLSREESDLEALSEAEVGVLAQRLGARVVRSCEEYGAMDRLRRLGTEIWRPVVLILLLFFFGEMLLQQAIGGRGGRAKKAV